MMPGERETRERCSRHSEGDAQPFADLVEMQAGETANKGVHNLDSESDQYRR